MILSTHIVEDVADLCPSMAIIAAGRIVRTGAPHELIESTERPGLAQERSARASSTAHRRDYEVISTRLFAGRTVIHVLADTLPGAGFEPVPGGLEDLYFSTLAQTAPPGRLSHHDVPRHRRVRAALPAQVTRCSG